MGSPRRNPKTGSAPCPPAIPGRRRPSLALDLAGERFGRLVAITRGPRHARGTTWLCACDCGQRVVVQTQNLRREMTRSCGCLHAEQSSRRLVQRRAA